MTVITRLFLFALLVVSLGGCTLMNVPRPGGVQDADTFVYPPGYGGPDSVYALPPQK
jgi:hypothetical protein